MDADSGDRRLGFETLGNRFGLEGKQELRIFNRQKGADSFSGDGFVAFNNNVAGLAEHPVGAGNQPDEAKGDG